MFHSKPHFYSTGSDYCIVAIGKPKWQVCKASHSVSKQQQRLLYYCLFAPHVYMGVILRAHPVRGESHIQCNASGEVATTSPPFHNKPHRSYILFCKACSWHDLHILVTAPFGHPVFFSVIFWS